jgi:phosphoglycolate phosphatase-like HAD superfamily hydrolase
MKNSKSSAIAFDFDGTLIRGGRLNIDKAVHIMYSSWIACRENGFEEFLRPRQLTSDVFQMGRAYIRYPGAPRFQQLDAILNALINRRYGAVASFGEFGLDERYRNNYERIRGRYNELYSALNNVAAAKYWKPYESAKAVLKTLHRDYDLYIASGVTQDILEEDFARHRFSRSLFKGIHGGTIRGGSDKGEILKSIRALGYTHVVFVADSNKDLEYANEAGVSFYRIRDNEDFARLPQALTGRIPKITAWPFSVRELRFMRETTRHLLERYVAGRPLTPRQITQLINR